MDFYFVSLAHNARGYDRCGAEIRRISARALTLVKIRGFSAGKIRRSFLGSVRFKDPRAGESPFGGALGFQMNIPPRYAPCRAVPFPPVPV